MTTAMRAAMQRQPAELRRLLDDRGAVARCAARLRDRRVLLVGTGTSWHAAHQGAWLLRAAGLSAWAVPAADAVAPLFAPGPGDAVLLLSHRGTKKLTSQVLQSARRLGIPTVVVSRSDNADADLPTVPNEQSSAFTVSHLAALLRLAQLATELGAELGGLADIPDLVAAELASGPVDVPMPPRLMEFAGWGINAWTAAEGALKIRETAYVAASGGSAEQILHGPAVALGPDDVLVCLDTGGSGSDRLAELGTAARAQGCRVVGIERRVPSEMLSIFPLTVVVQKIAVQAAERLGTNPDSFGKDLPGRQVVWDAITL